MDANYFEESLKRRMAAAKAAGWKDEDIRRSELVERSVFNRNFQEQEFKKKQEEARKATEANAKKPSGLKRFLVNTGALLGSTAAGIAGAAFAAPTGGASIAGAGVAGAGIEALRRKLLGENQSAGASIVEGALTALPGVGAAKSATKAAKAVKTVDTISDATKAAKAVSAAERTAEIAPKIVGNGKKAETVGETFKGFFKSAPDESRLYKKGTDIRGNVRGVFAGATDKGAELGVEESRRVNKVIDSVVGKTPKTAKQQLTIIERERKLAGKQIRDAIAKDNIVMDNPRRQKMGELIQKELQDVADFDPNNKAHVKLFNTLVKQVDAEDLLSVEKGRKNIDKIAKSAFKESDATTQFKARVAAAIRSGVDEFVTDASTASKAIKGKYRDLLKAEAYMTKEKVLRPKGARTQFLSFGEGKGIGGGTAQAVRDAGGRATQDVGRLLSTPAMQELGKQYGLRLLAGRESLPGAPGEPLQPVPEVPSEFTPTKVFTNPQSEDEAILNEVIAGGASDFETAAKAYADYGNQLAAPEDANITTGGDQTQQSPFGFTREDLVKAAYQAVQAGDYRGLKNIKDLDELLTSYETSKAKAAEAGGENGVKLSDTAIKIINDLQGGLSDISKLEETLTANPNVTGNFAGLMASKPFGFTINEQAASVQAQIDRVKQTIGKALEGGVLRKEDEEKYKKILPTIRDPQSVALSKIAELKRKLAEDLQNYSALQQSYGKGSTDIANLFQPSNQDIFNQQGAY